MSRDVERGQIHRQNDEASQQRVFQEAPGETEADVVRDALLKGSGPKPKDVAEGLGGGDGGSRARAIARLQQERGNAFVQQVVSEIQTRRSVGSHDGASNDGPVAVARASFPIGATVRALQRYEAGEHAQFGAKPGESDTTFTLKEGKDGKDDVQMTYGEVIAMGDLFENPDALRKAKPAELKALLKLIRKERDQGIGSVGEKDWIDAAGDRYLDLAGKNTAHFADPPGTTGFVEGDQGHKEQWYAYHKQALKLAQKGKQAEALFTNAFGDHFLTDAFSAGHLINKPEVMERAKKNLSDSKVTRQFELKVAAGILASAKGATLRDYEANPGVFRSWAPVSADTLADVLDRIRFWKGDKFYSTFAKAVHDKLNRDILPGGGGGVEVENNRGDTWHLSGDKTLSLSPKTLEIARDAVAQSRKNVEGAAGQSNLDFAKLAQLVWDYVPRPTKAGQAVVDSAESTLTDPNNQASVDAWVAITVDNFDAALDELVKNSLLRQKAQPAPSPAPASGG